MPGSSTQQITWGDGTFDCVCGSSLTVPMDADGVALIREVMFAHRPCSGLVQELVYDEVPDDASELDDGD